MLPGVAGTRTYTAIGSCFYPTVKIEIQIEFNLLDTEKIEALMHKLMSLAACQRKTFSAKSPLLWVIEVVLVMSVRDVRSTFTVQVW